MIVVVLCTRRFADHVMMIVLVVVAAVCRSLVVADLVAHRWRHRLS